MIEEAVKLNEKKSISGVQILNWNNNIPCDMERVLSNMREIAAHPFQDTPTGEVIDECLATTGKMLRARLLHICSGFGNKKPSDDSGLYRLSAMVELLHLASLIHDDIIDEAIYRRGRRSIQSRFGKDAAVYAGDYLMARVNYYVAVEWRNKASAVLSSSVADMCRGEILQARLKYRVDSSCDDYLQVILGKTASLFSAACRIGAEEGGCPDKITDDLSSFGRYLGIMFQLRDDLMDFTGEAVLDGKDWGKDLKSGIYTYPVLAALDSDSVYGDELKTLLCKNEETGLLDDELQRCVWLIEKTGGVDAAREELLKYKKKAVDILNDLPDCRENRLLLRVLKKLTA